MRTTMTKADQKTFKKNMKKIQKTATFHKRMKKLHLTWLAKIIDHITNPCNWGLHKDIILDRTYGNGQIVNQITGNSHKVPSIAELYLCTKCKRQRGHMESACGESNDFYGKQLDLLKRNTNLTIG